MKEQKEQKEKEKKLKEEKLKKEKEEQERKEKEEQERILREKEEKEEKEKKLKEKKLKEKEEKEKKKKELEEKKKRENERKELEKLLKQEEIKNNNDNKKEKEKEKEKEYIISYINSLDKKRKEFTPVIYKHPEKVYLKAINEYEMNREKMRKINHKNGKFDLILNRARANKYYINAENKEENFNKNNNNITDYNNKLKSSFNNNSQSFEKKNNFKKKKLLVKIGRDFSTGNSHLNSYKSPVKKENNIFSLNSNPNRKSIQKLIEKRNKSLTTKKINSDENREVTLNEMVQFLLENGQEVNSFKKPIISNHINHRKADKQKNKIINSLNDPCNPYSVLFYNNMLYNNFNVGIHYRNIKQGVPNLRIKKIKSNDLPPLLNVNKLREKMMANTYSTSFNSSNKKKNVVPPITGNVFKQNTSRKRLYTEGNEEKTTKRLENEE